MCEFFSAICKKDGKVVWYPGINGHSEILTKAKIADDSSELVSVLSKGVTFKIADESAALAVYRYSDITEIVHAKDMKIKLKKFAAKKKGDPNAQNRKHSVPEIEERDNNHYGSSRTGYETC